MKSKILYAMSRAAYEAMCIGFSTFVSGHCLPISILFSGDTCPCHPTVA